MIPVAYLLDGRSGPNTRTAIFMSDADNIEDALVESAQGAAETTNLAGERVKMHPLKDTIEALKTVQRKASVSSGRLPIRFFKLRPPGAV